MIMGANIGTTITAQIAALNAFPITKIFMVFCCVGILLYTFAKKEKPKAIGMMLAGFGMIFLALGFMSSSMKEFASSPELTAALRNIDNPFVLLILGIVVTALCQSSSATTSILISMVGAGITIGSGSNDIFYIVLGSNIGSCVTALISSLGASRNGKRASIIHLLFNTFGSIIFFIILICWKDCIDMTFGKVFANPETQIAMFHTFFNVVCTIIFLPFLKWLVKLACVIVPDKSGDNVSSLLDDRLLTNPDIALAQVNKETIRMGGLANEKLCRAIECFITKDVFAADDLKNELKDIDNLSKAILDYLVKVSSKALSLKNEEYITKLHRIIGDFNRISEIADNMIKYTHRTVDENLEFSDEVYTQLGKLKSILNQQYLLVAQLFDNPAHEILDEIEKHEEEIDNLRIKMVNEHIKRLENNQCSPANSGVYINLVSTLERAGDHLEFIAKTICDEQ
ncbi:MAG: Na/Pi cotransporter family protein, partial [Bacilli bacterium]|nr:Na/Pi cotransporter family protein [Bacilli bacterium]